MTQANSSVFILCGGRRTGTTLLNAILCSDERTNPLGAEAQIVTRLVEAYRWGKVNFDPFGESFFQNRNQFKSFFQETMETFTRETTTRISPGGILVLKNPELSLVLLDVSELFDNATFLATVRDPRDQIASEIEVAMRRLSDNDQDPAQVDRNVNFLANDYVRYYKEIFELQRRQPNRIHVIRYEDLVLNTKSSLHNLEKLTGLKPTFKAKTNPWLRVSRFAGLNTSPSRSDLYGRPIDKSSINRYKRDLHPDEIHLIEGVCSQIMESYNY